MATRSFPGMTSHALHGTQFALAGFLVLTSAILLHRTRLTASEQEICDLTFSLSTMMQDCNLGIQTAAILSLILSSHALFWLALLFLLGMSKRLSHPAGWVILNVVFLIKWIIALALVAYFTPSAKILRRRGVPRAFMIAFLVLLLLTTIAALVRDIFALRKYRSSSIGDDMREAKNTRNGMRRADTVDGAHDNVQDPGFRMAVMNAGLS